MKRTWRDNKLMRGDQVLASIEPSGDIFWCVHYRGAKSRPSLKSEARLLAELATLHDH
jgi:hypothetical protein